MISNILESDMGKYPKILQNKHKSENYIFCISLLEKYRLKHCMSF